MSKVQLSLTSEEAAILEGYGNQFGYSLPKTIRYIISNAAENFLREGAVPVFKMSEKTERAGLQALREQKQGKAVAVEDVNSFFDNL